MSLEGLQVATGAVVVANRNLPGRYRVNTNDTFDIAEGDRFVVTRVYNESLMVRSERTYQVRVSYHYTQKQVSFQIERYSLRFDDPNYVAPPPPRKLGTMPDKSDFPEGVEPIGIDHPGIQWLWDDMGAYATQQGYCPQYDALCIKLGIPGRPREFTVRKTINGIDIRADVMARSQREANEKFALAMASSSGDGEQERNSDESDG